MKRVLITPIIIFVLFLPVNLKIQDIHAQTPSSEVGAPAASLSQTNTGVMEGNVTLSGPATDTSSGLREKTISLNLRNIDVIEALKFFSLKTGFNIVPTHKVSGRVTLVVETAPAKDVFDIMLRSNSLAYDMRGQIYNVMTEDEYKKMHGKLFSDMREVKVFRLKYAIPEQAFALLDAMKSSIGRLLVDPESGTILIMDTAENIEEARKALEAMEQVTTVKVFNLKYAKAKDVEEQLKSQLDVKKVGSIKSDERTNSVIVQTLPERLKNIEQLITSLDKKTKAVLIETKIIKIALNNDMNTGVEWEGLFSVARQFGMTYVGSYPFSLIQSATASWQSRQQFLSGNMSGGVGAYPFSGTTSNFVGGSKVIPGSQMHVGIVDGKRDFDVLINYLQSFGKTKIIANPTIAVINNQEAKIHVGERQAYVTTTVTTGVSTTTTSEEVTFVDVGVRLSIIPLINDDGYVTMKIKPEISSVIGQVMTSSKNPIPIIDTSVAETTVIAKDGSTIILCGLGKEEKTENTQQVPVLSKIPVLGNIFRSKTRGVQRTELLIMLTPVIFEGDTLVTVKDKEMEQFGVKPMKKFDVFKPEVPGEALPGTSQLPKELFAPKFFKPYQMSALREGATPAAPLVAEGKAESFALKGVKSYDLAKDAVAHQVMPAQQAPAEDNKATVAPGPKEYRAYN